MNKKYLRLLHFCELNEYKYATLKFVLHYVLLYNLNITLIKMLCNTNLKRKKTN